MTTLEAALDYAARGFYVFPLKARSKEPATAHGLKDATIDPAQIRKWWGEHPTWNIAIATGAISGLVVFDIDGDEGMAALTAYLTERGETLPWTPTVTTSRGTHIYYRHPGGHVKSHRILPGVDVKADGGYVVAPPSVHPDNSIYLSVIGPEAW